MRDCSTCVHDGVCYFKDWYRSLAEKSEAMIIQNPWVEAELNCKHYDRSPAKVEGEKRNCSNCKHFNGARLIYAGPCTGCTSGANFNQPSKWEAKE